MVNKVEVSIGEKIRFYRERCELTQSQVEFLTELGSGVMSKIEKGNRNPTKETIIKIGSALKLDPEEVAHLLGINVYRAKHAVDIKSFNK